MRSRFHAAVASARSAQRSLAPGAPRCARGETHRYTRVAVARARRAPRTEDRRPYVFLCIMVSFLSLDLGPCGPWRSGPHSPAVRPGRSSDLPCPVRLEDWRVATARRARAGIRAEREPGST